MTERPSRTVTLLFSDIEGSTRLLGSSGRTATGRRSTTIGGSCGRRSRRRAAARSTRRATPSSCAFPRARMRRRPRSRCSAGSRLTPGRMAPPSGPDRRCTRPTRAGQGGSTSASASTARRGSAAPPTGDRCWSRARPPSCSGTRMAVALIDLGLHRLKDIGEPEHLFQLAADGLADRFPPLRSLRIGRRTCRSSSRRSSVAGASWRRSAPCSIAPTSGC